MTSYKDFCPSFLTDRCCPCFLQLAMTVLMTCVVIYIYTVIAFNFFRKFYRFQTPEGVEVFKCDNMFEVYNCKLSREVCTIRTEKKTGL